MAITLTCVFLAGYLLITAEQLLRINKAATALFTGVVLWTIFIAGSADHGAIVRSLVGHIGDFSGILFFLMAAMTIVELIDLHDGFRVITDRITTSNKQLLLCIIAILTFLLSAVLDNLTTTIVMVSLSTKLIPDRKDRLSFIGLIVIAANAGGAWSPIGDVTTTMLWIGGGITSANLFARVFIPSLLCLGIPLLWVLLQKRGTTEKPTLAIAANGNLMPFERNVVFFTGVSMLIAVPFFKALTHLPPYMGALFGLSVLWIVTEFMHARKNNEIKEAVSPASALTKIDLPSVLFFLGILLAISCLESAGVLLQCAHWLGSLTGNQSIIVFLLGIVSAIVDNVPLTAAVMGMYPLHQFPVDHHLWSFLAYCVGTGGSTLIIGSAAGVVAMGIGKISFFWYFKNFSLIAFAGYAVGAIWYLIAVGDFW